MSFTASGNLVPVIGGSVSVIISFVNSFQYEMFLKAIRGITLCIMYIWKPLCFDGLSQNGLVSIVLGYGWDREDGRFILVGIFGYLLYTFHPFFKQIN